MATIGGNQCTKIEPFWQIPALVFADGACALSADELARSRTRRHPGNSHSLCLTWMLRQDTDVFTGSENCLPWGDGTSGRKAIRMRWMAWHKPGSTVPIAMSVDNKEGERRKIRIRLCCSGGTDTAESNRIIPLGRDSLWRSVADLAEAR